MYIGLCAITFKHHQLNKERAAAKRMKHARSSGLIIPSVDS